MQTLFSSSHLLGAGAALRARGPRGCCFYYPQRPRTARSRGRHHERARFHPGSPRRPRIRRTARRCCRSTSILDLRFQRVGDLIWAAADSRARGFLVGGTAGRTTLAGEGLQHQTGLLALAPRRRCRIAAPTTLASAMSSRAIVRDGARRTCSKGRRMCSITSPSATRTTRIPRCPKGVEEGVLKGMYQIKKPGNSKLQTARSERSCAK